MKKVFGFVLMIGLAAAMPASAQWEPDARLTYDSGASYYPLMAASGSTLHIVWQDNRNGNFGIYTKRSPDDGTSWGADTQLSNSHGIAIGPSVAASGSMIHVVWRDNRDGNNEVYAKRSTDFGISWGPDTRLTSNSANSETPSVAASGSNVHAVWHDERDGNYEIYTKRSTDSGVSWGTDTRLTNNDSSSWFPSVAASGSNVYVVWYDNRNANHEIYAKRSTDSGSTWGADTRLTNDNSYSYHPIVAASGSNVHVVWFDTRDGNEEIYYKRSTNSGASWGGDTRLTNNDSLSRYPSVVASGSMVHVVWQDDRAGNDETYYKRSPDSGISWGVDTRLTYNGSNSYSPSVAVSGSNVHVAWYDNRAGNYEIYYKRNPTGNIGIEEGRGFKGPRVQGFKATPNPFTSFATLPGHEAERFSLYDVSGRKVGTYRGDRVGEGLAPGVYFLRISDSQAKPLRVVKVR